MTEACIRFEAVSFCYDGSHEDLLCGLALHFPRGWTGVVGANGAGKTTLLKLATAELAPTEGRRLGPADCVICEQRTDEAPDELEALLRSDEPEARRLVGVLGLDGDWAKRWETLSHGERKRAQLAVALWKEPAVLAVDEPTNHLDVEARALVQEALAAYEGIGLLVSHDRALLDRLCGQCVFLEPPHAGVRPGGYTAGAAEVLRERETLLRARASVDREVRALQAEAAQRREHARKNERQRSKKGVDKSDHDAKARINLARNTDGKSGRALRQLDGRRSQAQERRDALVVRKRHELGVNLAGERAPRERLGFVEAAVLDNGPGWRMIVPPLSLQREDRIGVVGPNGSGKSTLLRHVIASLSLPSSRVGYLPQEIDQRRSREVLEGFRGLPRNELGLAMSLVSRLGSRPERLLQSETPSPGEVRKMLLASCIVSRPYLLVLDEPTNHLDLPSIECLEEALVQTRAALLIVSHDPRFLERLTSSTWRMVRGPAPGAWKVA